MADAFDAYHKWLGIPPEDQPPDHYRLLAIKRFEEDPDVIAAAADRQMAHLRTYQTGPHAPLSQRLLNEVAAARVCLLNAEKKAAYDQQLRQQLEAKPAARRPPVVAHAAGPDARGSSGQETVEWTGLRELGEYRLLEKLGAGGMGEVYKAVHTEMDRVVAVKVLPPGHLQDEKAVARFKREIKAVASLNHPNIVQAHDAREIEGTRFLVMEYVEGMDLRDVAKRLGPLPIPDACELIRQAALGLQCAHEHGLVHRDIKPGNLMLSAPLSLPGRGAGGEGAQPVVKILDLGLARPQAEGGEGEVTGTGEAMGTADYMAPEQAQDSRSVDIRADLYSLGCTLYRLIAGQPPFGGSKYNTAVKKLMGHIQDPVPRITRFRSDVPKRLEIVLGRLLAKEPAKRLATPAEVAEALAPLSAGSDLAGLYTRAVGRIPAPPAPAQAEVPTHSRASSGLTRFFQRFQGAEPKAPDGRATAGGPPQRTPAWAGYAAIAAVALLIILAWGVMTASRPSREEPVGQASSLPASRHNRPAPTHPKTQHLVLHWPESERTDARLEIDRWPRPLAGLQDPDHPDLLKLEVNPGPHKVWIERRGFEPFEQTVSVERGQDTTIRVEWPEAPKVTVDKPEPKSEEKPKPKDVAVEKPKPKPEAKPEPPQPKVDPAILAREEKWRSSVEPIEKLAAAWDFAGAQTALAQVRFDEPELQQRLSRRRDELKRMAALKSKMIARIKAARPGLKKSDLGLRGINGEVTGADDRAIHARLSSGKAEDHPWGDLNDKARPELLKLAIDQASADDWLAGGLVAFAAGDVPLAEKLLTQAKKAGADIGPYLSGLAAASFADAMELLAAKKYEKADAALAALEKKYANTPWFADKHDAFTAARDAAKRGIYEAEAEELYADAAKLFGEEELFNLRDLVNKLRLNYPESAPVKETQRKPSFSEMQKKVADLGKKIVVRLDGRGDFVRIQEAINKAEDNSLIQIEDNGPYNERIVVPPERRGLTIRGRKGCWPIITSAKPDNILFETKAPGIRLDHLVLLHLTPVGHDPRAFAVTSGSCRIHQTIMHMPSAKIGVETGATANFCDCLFLSMLYAKGGGSLTNCILTLKTDVWLIPSAPFEIRYCTTSQILAGSAAGVITIRDSIVRAGIVHGDGSRPRVGNCDVLGELVDVARDAPCFSADPQFRDPRNLDFRLIDTSPCRGKASDGGDIGCRYTPEMIEMCKKALELRAKGIIKF